MPPWSLNAKRSPRLQSVTGRINAVFENLDFELAADNEHIFYIKPEVLGVLKPGLQKRVTM
jgi:hypothetical protein